MTTAADSNREPEFRLLSDEEFKALSKAERIEYLQRAVRLRNEINRQLDLALLIKKLQ
jgi:hypothetical protein